VVIHPNSWKRLSGVHPDLVSVVERAAALATNAGVSFIVTEGLRALARQEELLKAGATTTLKSRHLTGHAVDLAVVISGEVRWDWPLYHKLASIVKHAAQELQIPIEWGGDWEHFKDGPHYQLPVSKYPAKKEIA
jgi:peptidoglycan L-alanyl-D-glutamate endopeptidase CwlK